MNIILVSNKLAKAKSLSTAQTTALVAGLVLLPVLLTLLFITPKSNIKQQGVKAILPPQLKNSIISSQVHLDAYAKELGELQARMMRLDAQNERLSKLAGDKTKTDKNDIKANSANSQDAPGRGGPLVYAKPMTEPDLQDAIADLTKAIDERDEYLSALEARVLQQSVLKDMLPNASPIRAAYNSSSYGWRIDPFNGNKAFHEGLDFTASQGTSIYAAADGIVAAAERTPDYGNLVKVDHGSGLETRYAHASRLLVKVGERVVKGQKIAEVGSTGRSTGPHLHYEIRLNGNPLDPRKYLQRNIS
ncbi:MAG TPA: M23 family metallopeptidase [Methylophilus sp.]|nr:M23 family metallopeptidase [Methylophilus sp.]HQQ33107.1 M23 family metallopeptidase [Methylophilus sp.]